MPGFAVRALQVSPHPNLTVTLRVIFIVILPERFTYFHIGNSRNRAGIQTSEM